MKRQPIDERLRASADVHGHVERFEGCYLVGWAAPADWGSHSDIRVVTAAGEEVAAGLANQQRADLASLGHGRCDLAFRILVPNLGDLPILNVFADGTELPGSPVFVGAGLYDGYTAVSGDTVSGWVSERQHGASAPEVEIVDQDGAIVCVLQSAFAGSDPSAGDAACYSGLLHQRCFLHAELLLTARVEGKPFANPRSSLSLLGHIDHVGPDRITGWLHAPAAPRRSFDLEIYRDGELVARARTSLRREDVQAAHPAAERTGFDVVLPLTAAEMIEAAIISVRLAGCDQDILGGPRLVGGQAALVQAARRAARSTLLAGSGTDQSSSAVLSLALARFLEQVRTNAPAASSCVAASADTPRVPWDTTVIIPCYADAAVTRECILSVIEIRDPAQTRLILLNDASPDPAMAGMLQQFSPLQNVSVITNGQNLGFIGTVNRGLAMCESGGDVLLLNSDTIMFPGALEGLRRALHSAPDIGTATAMSNTATIFSYPHESTQTQALDDIAWDAVAEVARMENSELAIEVPTGHGFCMLIREDVLRRVGLLDTIFGRGYGEENDYCARASDLGYRHVLAADVFVQHREGVSFGPEKAALVQANLARLGRRYPEYTAFIMEFIAREGLRSARWAIDRWRIRALVDSGKTFVLVINHGLGGGTGKAVRDIEAAVGYGDAIKLSLVCTAAGNIELTCDAPMLRVTFAADEVDPLFDLLSRGGVGSVIVHSLLGFTAEFVHALGCWAASRKSTFYAHDFYAVCPRVTMIDASESFCDIAAPDVCRRCVEQGGVHEESRLGSMAVTGHRELFGDLLTGFSTVIAPSGNTAAYLRRAFPRLKVTALPHPEPVGTAVPLRGPGALEVVLFGALGPHKGSGRLLALARRATLVMPQLRFKVIGYTDIDDQLAELGNVTLTGRYDAERLPQLASEAQGRAALFLHRWPETYSYTLSEALRFGFLPMVPDIGAPAERIRANGIGVVFPFDIDMDALLRLTASVLTDAAVTGERAGPRKAMPAAMGGVMPQREIAQPKPRSMALGQSARSKAA